MKQRSTLICPNCESPLNRETAPSSEGYVNFDNWKGITCPCCNFFVENTTKPCADWDELERIAIGLGAKVQICTSAVPVNPDLFDRIEAYLESKLPDPTAAALLQDLEAAEVERTSRALRERFVISEPSPRYDKDR